MAEIVEIERYLVGAGHFGVGFVLGFVWMHQLFAKYRPNLNVQLYAPFLPMIVGIWAAIPYPFFMAQAELPIWLHLFVFFPFLHTDELFIILLGRPAFVALLCGALYITILYHYIKLAKSTRRYGWQADKEVISEPAVEEDNQHA